MLLYRASNSLRRGGNDWTGPGSVRNPDRHPSSQSAAPEFGTPRQLSNQKTRYGPWFDSVRYASCRPVGSGQEQHGGQVFTNKQPAIGGGLLQTGGDEGARSVRSMRSRSELKNYSCPGGLGEFLRSILSEIGETLSLYVYQ